MRIGIDIDDTTFKTVDSMLKYADIFNKEIGGMYQNNGNYGMIKNRYYLKALYGWDDKTKEKFFMKYYKNVLEECVLLSNASYIINRLKDDGHTIHFITARLEGFENFNTEDITKKSLEKYQIKYDDLSLGVKDKLAFCLENNIDLMIEDSFETCKELMDNGIETILMTTIMNKNIENNGIKRVNSWNEIYEEIKKLSN